MRLQLIVEAEGNENDLLDLTDRIFNEPDVLTVEGKPTRDGPSMRVRPWHRQTGLVRDEHNPEGLA